MHLLPTVWFRNTWSWGLDARKPRLSRERSTPQVTAIKLNQNYYGSRWLYCEGRPELLFTENETNAQRLFGVANESAYVKDGINDYIVHGAKQAVNPAANRHQGRAHYRDDRRAWPDDRGAIASERRRARQTERLRRPRFDRVIRAAAQVKRMNFTPR